MSLCHSAGFNLGSPPSSLLYDLYTYKPLDADWVAIAIKYVWAGDKFMVVLP